MKLIYFLKDNREDKKCVGIYNKVYGQLKAFLEYGIDSQLFFTKENFLMIHDINSGQEKVVFIFKNKFQKKFFIYRVLFEQILKINPEYIYIRYPMVDMFFLSFLKDLKKIKNKIDLQKIALEFPTYPYDREAQNIKTKILVFIDKLYRNKIHKFVDFAVTYTDYKKIYGINSIFIENGIDIKSVKISKRLNSENEIVLIGVANVSFWHGFDRVIEGLRNYYLKQNNKYNIKFHIVGEGESIEQLKTLVDSYVLNENVIFWGNKTGKELDFLFDNADIGIGGIGGHRRKVFLDSALKNREYCARAVPFIIASDDNDLVGFKYKLQVKKDDSFVDMQDIINFYEKDILNNPNYKLEMREFSENNLSWTSKIKKVVEQYKNYE